MEWFSEKWKVTVRDDDKIIHLSSFFLNTIFYFCVVNTTSWLLDLYNFKALDDDVHNTYDYMDCFFECNKINGTKLLIIFETFLNFGLSFST